MLYHNELEFENDFNVRSAFSSYIVNKTYSDFLVLFLSDLSKYILKNSQAKKFPDLISFAYFVRKSNLLKFKNLNYSNNILEKKIGRGVCLHIAPSNIPMNFAFSLVMGLMAGNSNIVRLPSKKFEQIDIFVRIFSDLVSDEKYLVIKENTFFIRTLRESKKLLEIVSYAHSLVVWGGDVTVEKFRSYPKKPSCQEVYFPNKKSSLIVKSKEFISFDNKKINMFLQGFYNDTYLFDQNACSSPSMLIWFGEKEDNINARNKFINSLVPYLRERYSFNTSYTIDKILDLIDFCNASNSSIKVDRVSQYLWFVESDKSHYYTPKLGVFINKEISEISEAERIYRMNEQTVTYSGLSKNEVSEFVKTSRGKIDRLVPVGKALDMGFIWDGKNIIDTLSKNIVF